VKLAAVNSRGVLWSFNGVFQPYNTCEQLISLFGLCECNEGYFGNFYLDSFLIGLLLSVSSSGIGH